MKIYIVKKGDTLYQIAQKYGVEIEDILSVNPLIYDPDELKVGLKVKIPKKPTHVVPCNEQDDASEPPFKQYDIPSEKVGSFYDIPELGEMNHQSFTIGQQLGAVDSASVSQQHEPFPQMQDSFVQQPQMPGSLTQQPYSPVQHPHIPYPFVEPAQAQYPPFSPFPQVPIHDPYSHTHDPFASYPHAVQPYAYGDQYSSYDLGKVNIYSYDAAGTGVKPMLLEPLSTEPLNHWQSSDRTEDDEQAVVSELKIDDPPKKKSNVSKVAHHKSGGKQQAVRGSKVKSAYKKSKQRQPSKDNVPWQP